MSSAFGLSSLDGKVAIITGGTQGLGEATAHLFADRGAKGLVICGRNERNAAKAPGHRKRYGPRNRHRRRNFSDSGPDLASCNARVG